MAEIEMERRPRRHVWLWVLAAVVVVALALGAWFLLMDGGPGYTEGPGATEPAREQPYDYADPAAPGAERPVEPEPRTR